MRSFKAITGVALLVWSLPLHAALQLFACEPEWASLGRELGGDRVSVYSATTAHQDVHRIQARPSLIAKLRDADLLICTGAELEAGWLPLLLRRAANPAVQPGRPGYLMAAEQVARLDIHTRVDRSMGDVHAAGNPHVHLNPYHVATIADVVTSRLMELDSENSGYYQQRLRQFLLRWRDAIKRWEQQALPLKGTAVVVHHKDWRYLLDWLGMREVASLEPKPGMPPTASHLAQLKRQMAREPAAMILRAGYQEARPSLWLAEKSSIPVVELPYTVGGGDGVDDLFSLYEETISRMIGALQ